MLKKTKDNTTSFSIHDWQKTFLKKKYSLKMDSDRGKYPNYSFFSLKKTYKRIFSREYYQGKLHHFLSYRSGQNKDWFE